MIENSIVDHNQEIDLNLKKLENASIVGKKCHIIKDCWHLNKKNKLKVKMIRMIVRKIL